MNYSKKILQVIFPLLMLTFTLLGCIEESHSFVVAPLRVGDKFLYDVNIVYIQRYASKEKKSIINGTIFSSVNGSETISDGFGREKKVIKFYTRLNYTYPTSSFTQHMYEYLDTETGFPLKSVLCSPNITYEFYPSLKFYRALSENPFSSYSLIGGLTFSPVDICKLFEGKTIKKGDKGTIEIFGKEINWEAIGEEKVNNYRCIKVRFVFEYFHVFKYDNQSHELKASFDYTLWFSDTFPQLIEGRVIISMQAGGEEVGRSTFSAIIKDFGRGNETISWGKEKPTFPSKVLYGDFGKWVYYPPTGNKSTNISFKIERIIDYLKTANLSYLNSHPDSRILVATYSEILKRWQILMSDETGEGYLVEISCRGNITKIVRSREIKLSGLTLPKEKTVLTFSGCESVARRFIAMEKNFTVSFGINSSLLTRTKGLRNLKLGPAEIMFDSIYSPLYVFSTSKDAIAIDGETGQVILVVKAS